MRYGRHNSMPTMNPSRKFHCVYSLSYHFVFVTKYRRAVFGAAELDELGRIWRGLLTDWGGELLEFNGEADHVHLLVRLPPTAAPSAVANNLKTVSSRLLRKRVPAVRRFYKEPVLWSRSYFVSSCGGAPLAVIKQYIQAQERPA